MSTTTSTSTVDSKRIAVAALFTAASLVLSFIQIPIFPAAPFLMYDPSGIVCLIAALAFGPGLGTAVSIISWLPRLFLDPFGVPMGIMNTLALILPASIIYLRAGRTRSGSIIGMVVGAVLAIIVSCAMNLVITPLYSGMTVAQVAAMIVPILLPFNALKMVIHVVVGQALLTPCMNVLDAQKAGSSRDDVKWQ